MYWDTPLHAIYAAAAALAAEVVKCVEASAKTIHFMHF